MTPRPTNRTGHLSDFKCVDCGIRLRTHGGATGQEPCPGCGAPLNAVEELSELVGFRAVGRPVEGLPAERFGDRVSPLADRRDAEVARLRVAVERWLDEGGSFDPGALDSGPPKSER
jgi:hypothetical protein